MEQILTDRTVFTQFQQFIGTPAHISPEQAEMNLAGNAAAELVGRSEIPRLFSAPLSLPQNFFKKPWRDRVMKIALYW